MFDPAQGFAYILLIIKRPSDSEKVIVECLSETRDQLRLRNAKPSPTSSDPEYHQRSPCHLNLALSLFEHILRNRALLNGTAFDCDQHHRAVLRHDGFRLLTCPREHLDARAPYLCGATTLHL